MCENLFFYCRKETGEIEMVIAVDCGNKQIKTVHLLCLCSKISIC